METCWVGWLGRRWEGKRDFQSVPWKELQRAPLRGHPKEKWLVDVKVSLWAACSGK